MFRSINLMILGFSFIFKASVLADIGTKPSSFSCDEMYYSYYYDYEKLRQVYHKFESLNSSCNKPVVDWLNNPETGEDNGHYRSHLAYTVENKEEMLHLLKEVFDLPEDVTIDSLKDEQSYNELVEKYKLPRLLTKEDFQRGISKESDRIKFFADLEKKNLNNSRADELMDFLEANFKREWVPPVVGHGAGSTKMKGYYRIDLLGEPLDLTKAKNLKCSQIYRGFNNTCEQDCLYMRNVAIDIQAKMRLWQQEWDWENQKMICTPQNQLKGAVIPFDSPFCRLSCPGGEVECSTCSYKVNKNQKNPMNVTCMSEYDAKHVADLYCYLNNGKGCAEVTCNSSKNIHDETPETITALNEYSENFKRNHSVGFEVKTKVSGSSLAAGVEVEGDVKLGIKGGITIYSQESATLIDKFFTRRSDGKVFECPSFMADKNYGEIRCGDLDDQNPRYRSSEQSSCGKDKNGYDLRFGPCKLQKTGEPRAFFRCHSKVEEVKSLQGKGFAGFNLDATLPLAGGAEIEVYGNTKHGFDLATVVSARSKEFNAGGLSLEHMKNTCERWQDQWTTISLSSQMKDKWIMNLDPMSFFDSQKLDLKTYGTGAGTRLNCTIKNTDGTQRRASIEAIEAMIEMKNSDGDKDTKNKRKLKEKVFKLAFHIHERRGDLGFLSDILKKDTLYPVATPPFEKDFFELPYENIHTDYFTSIMKGDMSAENLANMIESITPLRKGKFELRNCEVIKDTKKYRRLSPYPTLFGPSYIVETKSEVILKK